MVLSQDENRNGLNSILEKLVNAIMEEVNIDNVWEYLHECVLKDKPKTQDFEMTDVLVAEAYEHFVRNRGTFSWKCECYKSSIYSFVWDSLTRKETIFHGMIPGSVIEEYGKDVYKMVNTVLLAFAIAAYMVEAIRYKHNKLYLMYEENNIVEIEMKLEDKKIEIIKGKIPVEENGDCKIPVIAKFNKELLKYHYSKLLEYYST